MKYGDWMRDNRDEIRNITYERGQQMMRLLIRQHFAAEITPRDSSRTTLMMRCDEILREASHLELKETGQRPREASRERVERMRPADTS